jgi:hypothetical protein
MLYQRKTTGSLRLKLKEITKGHGQTDLKSFF